MEMVESGVEIHVLDGIERRLAEGERGRTPGDERRDGLVNHVVEIHSRDRPIDDAQLNRLGGTEPAAGEHHVEQGPSRNERLEHRRDHHRPQPD